MERGQVLFEETVVEEEELWHDDEDNYEGWHCVRTDPFPCPAAGCTFVAEFMTAAHLILVWQERDDPNLLKHAARARDLYRAEHPGVVKFWRTCDQMLKFLSSGGCMDFTPLMMAQN